MRARGIETRRAILRAAERVFASRGYGGARMDEVALDVGIRRASMVYYFRDKRELYVALLDDLFGDLLRDYESMLAQPGSAGDRILGCIDVWCDHVVQRPGLLRITIWEMARERTASTEVLATRLAPVLAAIHEAIEAGQRDGEFRPVNPLNFMMTMAGATAFLTLGSNLLTDGGPVSAGDLRSELRVVARRLLFTD